MATKKITKKVSVPRKVKAEIVPAPAPVSFLAYKGFDKNLQCRGMQYAIGQSYTHPGKVDVCRGGLHFCDMPLDVLRYYKDRFASVEVFGEVSRGTDGDSKGACAQLTVKAELKIPDLIAQAVRWILDRAKGNTATGNYGHAAATGYCGHAAATGYYGHAAATGNCGHAAATGYSGHAAATGNCGHAAATGNSGHAAATGNSGHAAATGYYGAAFTGYGGKAKAGLTGAFCIAWFDQKAERCRLIVGMPGENGIQADTFYSVNDSGQLVESP